MQKIIIDKNSAGERLDKFLSQEFFSLSRGAIAKKIKEGQVRVNNRAVKISYNLKENDVIEIDFEIKKEELVANPEIKLDILFQNPNFIALNKPAGIQVHPDANEKKNTLVNGLIARFSEIIPVHDETPGAEFRPGIVHRLDKDTSGVMLVAKNMETFQELKKLFQERKIVKKYVAVIFGKLKESRGEIRKPIARAGNYKKQTVAGAKTRTKIRPAVTKYKVLQEVGNYTLLEVFPKTGRMHQIRIHFASIRLPIVGDKLYVPKDLRKKMPKLKRHSLHAQRISFNLFGERYSFQAGLPLDFQDFLDGINKKG